MSAPTVVPLEVLGESQDTNGEEADEQEGEALRYYRIHPGRNFFCCGGRAVFSRQLHVFALSLGLLIGVTILFFAFEARFLTPILSPAVPFFAALLFLYVLLTLLRTAFTDPGIIPRATKAELEWTEAMLDHADPNVQHIVPPSSRIRQVLINGYLVKLTFCQTCHIFRPPRASHCSTCDNCVERFDHHCPWVGNCVGRRNYRYFILFNYSLMVYCLYVVIFAVVNLVLLYKRTNDVLDTLKTSPASLIEILVAFFLMWTVVGLSGYHTLLMCREFSTHEDLRGLPKSLRQAGHKNPYAQKNPILNYINVLCGPILPNLIRGWEPVERSAWPVNSQDLRTMQRNQPPVQSWQQQPGGYPRQLPTTSQPITNGLIQSFPKSGVMDALSWNAHYAAAHFTEVTTEEVNKNDVFGS